MARDPFERSGTASFVAFPFLIRVPTKHWADSPSAQDEWRSSPDDNMPTCVAAHLENSKLRLIPTLRGMPQWVSAHLELHVLTASAIKAWPEMDPSSVMLWHVLFLTITCIYFLVFLILPSTVALFIPQHELLGQTPPRLPLAPPSTLFIP
ncbi:uncharacterized protein TRIREDRAFT_104175 [Trichoderma reesei QM6a]|uniref:Predicted protein n=2 Tax=Hypocrea jecorina TaxID=51453 RepID=G0RBN2_HYPJQ|nr:uncharacterized protein TRIREDRAFT_104175 [Trichoderma reesei QM6a]EGR51358.1 predicted protein [Trichoderma reesei QM6a]ETS04763.1 hypothetical protein M419DRAFT_73593 [Trichoderma reesei RUT C-30]